MKKYNILVRPYDIRVYDLKRRKIWFKLKGFESAACNADF